MKQWYYFSQLFFLLSASILSLNYTSFCHAQISLQSIATDLDVCGESNSLNLSLMPTEAIMNPIEVQILFSEGIEFVENSLTVLENPSNLNLNIVSNQASELQLQITLNASSLWEIGIPLTFEIQRTATCAAIDFAQVGGTFEEEIFVSQNETVIANQSANYGIQFASLSIFQPAPVVGASGQKIFRDITINNGGFACTDDVTYYVVTEQGLEIEAIRFGLFSIPLTYSGDTVFANLNDILLGVGNFDTCFDDGESIELIEELRAYSCNTILIETQHNVLWGCNDNEDCNAFSGTTGNVVIEGGTDEPQIRIEPLQYNSPGTCTNGQGEFLVINDGTPNENDPGYVINLLVNLEWDFSKIIPPPCPILAGTITNIYVNDILYEKGSYQSGLYALNLAGNQNPDLDITDADGDGFYDDLLPNDTLHIRYEIDFFCFEDCFCDVGILTDISSILYSDFCGASLYEKPVESGFTVERSYSIPQASLSNNIKVGEKGTIEICSNIDQNLNCPSDQSKLIVGISDSLALSPDLPNAYLTDGTPLTATVQNDTIEVTGIEGISVNCVNLDLIWTGEEDPETYQINFEFLYECEQDCDCFEAIDCGFFSIAPEIDPIPDTCVNLIESAATVKRQNLGWKDFNLQEKVNPSEDALNLQFALACDTIRYQSQSFVEEPLEELSNMRLWISYAIPEGSGELLEWLSGSFSWYDSEVGESFNCPIPNGLTSFEVVGEFTRAADFSLEELFESCGLQAADFSQGDSLSIESDFLVLETGLNNDFVINPTIKLDFIAEDAGGEPFRFACSGTATNILLYQNKTELPDSTYTIASCETQTLSIEWGNDIDTLQNGPTDTDFFPNEIRPVFRFDSVIFRFPTALQFVEGSARMNYLPNPQGDYFLQPNQIEVIEEGEKELTEYRFVNDGNWSIGDRISFLKDTTGNETIAGYFQLDFLADCSGYDEIEAIFYIEDNYHSSEPNCRNKLVLRQVYPVEYFKPQIGANLITTNLDGVAGQVTAQLEYCNNTGGLGMSNAFLLFEAEEADIFVESANVGTLTTTSDGFQILELGDLAPLECVDIELQLSYTNCVESSQLKVFYSWDCAAYPNTMDGMKCDRALRSVTINPKEAEVQLDVETPSGMIELCDTLYYEFVINSAQLANITDPVLILDLPPLQGLTLTDSTMIEYPLGTAARSFTATTNGNQLVVDLGGADAENEPIGNIATLGINGFALSSNADERKARIRLGFVTDCNFVSGSSIRASVFANLPCGAPALGSGFSQILPPISIQNTSVDYQTVLQLSALPLQACENTTTTVEVVIFPADNQSIEESDARFYVFLPENLNYADNSLQVVSGSVETPEIVPTATGEQLDFPIQYSDNPLDSIIFSFEVMSGENFACVGESIELIAQTIELQNANCSTDNEDCNLAIQTNEGNAFFEIPVQGPAVSISSAVGTVDCSNTSGEFELTVSLENTGNQSSQNGFVIEVYLDNNFNGILDAEDIFVGDFSYGDVIGTGETVSIIGIFQAAEFIGIPILVTMAANDNCETCMESPFIINNLSIVNNSLSVSEQLFCLEEEEAYEIVLSIEGGTPPYTISGSVETTTSWNLVISEPIALGTPYSILVTDANGCFAEIAGIGDCVTLPIELIAFEGIVQENGNFLQWFTASETNNDFYTLERSTDGKNFEAIATIEGAGTISKAQNYSFLDRFAPSGISYYQLSQTDLDATTRYLGTISLHREKSATSKLQIKRIYPVPTSDLLFVEFSNPSLQNLELDLVNTLGQMVLKQHIEGSTSKVEVDCSGLELGLYLLKIGEVWEKVVVR